MKSAYLVLTVLLSGESLPTTSIGNWRVGAGAAGVEDVAVVVQTVVQQMAGQASMDMISFKLGKT